MFKKEEILHLEADSPDQLGKQLEYLQEDGKLKRHGLASLDIYGHAVLIRQFELPILKPREISHVLRMEAVELLSSAPNDLEIDYHTVTRSKDTVSGVFVAVSKSMLEQYMAFLRKAKLVPVSIGARILNVMNEFLYSHAAELKGKIFCVIDCTQKSIADLAVFENGNLRLLREIPYAGIEELKQEISQSLRYYLSKDGTKKLSEVYISGELAQGDSFLKGLEQDFEATVIKDAFDGSHKKIGTWKKKESFRINLIKRHAVTLGWRNAIIYGLDAAIVAGILWSGFLWKETVQMRKDTAMIKSKYTVIDYGYAKGLQTKKEMLKNGK